MTSAALEDVSLPFDMSSLAWSSLRCLVKLATVETTFASVLKFSCARQQTKFNIQIGRGKVK